jgi:hypothetical protein
MADEVLINSTLSKPASYTNTDSTFAASEQPTSSFKAVNNDFLYNTLLVRNERNSSPYKERFRMPK